MKTLPLMLLISGGVLALTTGCAERRVTYVPVYPTQPAYAGQTVYTYPNQAAYAPPPGTISAPAPSYNGQLVTINSNLPPTTLDPNQPSAQPTPQVVAPTVMAPAAPPAPQVEVVPVTPGPDYVWMPGYWSWNGTVWIWVGGRWGPRPYPHAVWVGPHWVRHGHYYAWQGGHWR